MTMKGSRTVPTGRWVFLILSVLDWVHCQNGQCSNKVLTINPDADVKFTVIMTLRQSADGNTCGDKLSAVAIQNIAGLKWTVNRINSGNFVHGVTIGFDVYDDCGLRRRSIAQAVHVLEGFILGTEGCSLHSNGTACHMGIIGTSRSSTTEDVLYALNDTSLPVLSPYATRTSLFRYPNFYRTVTSDDIHIKAIVHLLKVLDLSYVSVVNEDDAFGRYAAGKMHELARENGICVDVIQTIKTGADLNPTQLIQQKDRTKDKSLRVVFFGSKDVASSMLSQLQFHNMENVSWVISNHAEDDLGPFGSNDSLGDGTIIVVESILVVEEVVNYVNQIWTKVLAKHTPSDELEQLMNCSEERAVPTWSNENVLSTIDAVFVFASALQRQQNLYCGSNDGVCDSLKKNFKIVKDMKDHPVIYGDILVNVTVPEFAKKKRIVDFDDKGDLLPDAGSALFDVNFVSTGKRLVKLGEYRNETFIASNDSVAIIADLETSQCRDSCPTCVEIPEIPFAYIDGDSLLLGIFSVHETDPENPFKCANLRLTDVIIVESFLHTVEMMRKETGINFGAIVIDDCYSSARTELMLSQILAGKVKLQKPGSNEFIDVSRILAVISSSGSSVTLTITSLLTHLNIPSISSSASSPDLDDKINFPYFLRTVPSDVEQVRALLSIIQEMGWTYVSFLYVENNYGSKGKELFMRMANTSGICVAENPEGITETVDNKTASDLRHAFTRLSNHQSDVVVYFGTEARIANFLEVINGSNQFIFLSSEDWGDRKYILKNGGQSAKGSIILKIEVAGLFDDTLTEYIKSINPATNLRNPWFIAYWEEMFGCDLSQSFNNKYTNACDPKLTLSDATVQQYLIDQWLVNTVDAVKAVGKGLRKSKESYCKFENSFPCSKYFQYVADVVKSIREVKINRGGNEVRIFNEAGNGNIGFNINNVQATVVNGNTELDYVSVGSYNAGILKLETNRLEFYRPNLDGLCSGSDCSHCANESLTATTTLPTTTHVHPKDEEFGVPDYTIIGILGFLFVVIVILFIFIVCYFRRRIKELETQLKKTTFEMRTGYMTSHNGSAFSNQNTEIRTAYMASHNGSSSVTYPELQFANTSPSGETMYEWRKAQNHLIGNGRVANGGVVNKGFVGGSEVNIPAQHDEDENQNYPSTSSANIISNTAHSPSQMDQSSLQLLPDSPVHKPSSSTSYGLSSNSSFKRPADLNTHVKKQPRTQLAVPPCRPELPPRDQQRHTHAHRPSTFPENFDHLSSAVPKDKVRKVRSSPRRTAPPSLKYTPSSVENQRYRTENLDSPPYKGSPTNMAFSAGSLQPKEHQISPSGMINLAGSMEKVSRV